MMFGLFKKKTLPNKVLILNAIPYSIEKFQEHISGGKSDFIRSLISLYGVENSEELWRKFDDTATLLKQTLNFASRKGATVIEDASLQDFQMMVFYDVIIIIAHHSDNSDEIEFQGNLITSSDVIRSIPSDTYGVIDITSCYSAFLLPKIKIKAPNSTIIGIDIATSLPFRLLLLEETFKVLCKERTLGYKDGLIKVLKKLPSAPDSSTVKESSSVVHLGNEQLKSTAFAPKEAERGEDFMVSVFIHKIKESEEVELMARGLDDNAVLQNAKTLSLKIRNGDKIDFQLSCAGKDNGDFTFDENKKGIVWNSEIVSVEFCVSVSADCKRNSFIGKLKIAVNKIPAGEMLFKTTIVDKKNLAQAKECAELNFVPYNSTQEQRDSETEIVTKLERQRVILQKELESLGGEAEQRRENILLDINICETCIALINQTHLKPKPRMLKVFISSTSDLQNYRQVIREQVESCEMYPDMYERWGQGNDYPRDMCCRHVLDSDIFVCLLGAKYGFIEPAWGMSMTEIEFRVAMKANKPILIYIQKQYKEEMEKLLPEHISLVELQKKLIDELREKRMVGFFSNEMSLALLSVTELLTLKHTLL